MTAGNAFGCKKVEMIMKWPYLVVPLALVLGTALWIYPGTYIYGKGDGSYVYRVNRFTGVKEHATDNGWTTDEQELKAAEKEANRLNEERTRELLSALSRNEIARVWNSGGQLQVTFTDHSTAFYNFAPNTLQPILTELKKKNVPLEGTF